VLRSAACALRANVNITENDKTKRVLICIAHPLLKLQFFEKFYRSSFATHSSVSSIHPAHAKATAGKIGGKQAFANATLYCTNGKNHATPSISSIF
jgi:hypothetical protein